MEPGNDGKDAQIDIVNKIETILVPFGYYPRYNMASVQQSVPARLLTMAEIAEAALAEAFPMPRLIRQVAVPDDDLPMPAHSLERCDCGRYEASEWF